MGGFWEVIGGSFGGHWGVIGGLMGVYWGVIGGLLGCRCESNLFLELADPDWYERPCREVLLETIERASEIGFSEGQPVLAGDYTRPFLDSP